MTADEKIEASETLCKMQSKCLQIIRENPTAGAYNLMILAMTEGMSLGADDVAARFAAKMAIAGAKGG